MELVALWCLGKTIEGSGSDEAWMEVGLYSSVTFGQIVNGSNLNRSVESHTLALQAIFNFGLRGILRRGQLSKMSRWLMAFPLPVALQNMLKLHSQGLD